VKCEKCNQKLNKIDRRTEMTGLVDSATDGQMADYLAAELSGDHGSWSVGIVEYQCPDCSRVYQSITDELKSYDPLIVSWHDKAKEGDFFSRFVFEYLGFVALLHNKLFIGIGSDRRAIQALKNDSERERIYVAAVANSEPLQMLWQDVITELSRAPLHNSSRDLDNPEIDIWWNNSDYHPVRDDDSQKGVIRSLSDWSNMVEFWHSVRNNLFHGGKNPTIKRDCFLVEHAYQTMVPFMENEIEKL
jgi:hypothetical protein